MTVSRAPGNQYALFHRRWPTANEHYFRLTHVCVCYSEALLVVFCFCGHGVDDERFGQAIYLTSGNQRYAHPFAASTIPEKNGPQRPPSLVVP